MDRFFVLPTEVNIKQFEISVSNWDDSDLVLTCLTFLRNILHSSPWRVLAVQK